MPDEPVAPATTTRYAIAAEVRAELARQRKTQRDVGEVLGIPQASVFHRLKGNTAFRAEEIVALADWLNVPAERFLTTPAPIGGAA